MASLTFDPFIPIALWAPLAIFAGALWAWYAVASRGRLPRRRWPVVIALMGLALALPLAILLNPSWLERVPPPAGKPLLTILVDRSASMATHDHQGTASRYDAACQTAQEAAKQLEDRYKVRVRTFAETSALVASSALPKSLPDGTSTDLALAVEESLDPDRPQGQAMLILSDGAHNAAGGQPRVRESMLKAKAMATALYCRAFGGQTEVPDLAVMLPMPQELAFAGQRIPVSATLVQRGSLASRAALSLVYDGKPVEKRDVELRPNGTTQATFHASQPTAGLYRYEVKADPIAGEVTDLNNTAALLVRVVDQPVRVLLLEGKPYWDTKFLIRTLSVDPSIDLTCVVQMAEGRLLERRIRRAEVQGPEPGATRPDEWSVRKDAAKLLTPETLASYQVVVLGRDADVFLNDQALARLKKWLTESEGSLVCFRGPPASQISERLNELLPVRWTPTRESRFRVHWTAAGQAMRWLPGGQGEEERLTDLPSLASVARAERTGPLAEVLAAATLGRESQEPPVISYQPVGSGRVVVIEGAGMWRWAFLPPQHQEHDATYGTLWRSLVRWLLANVGLLPSEQMALRTDKVTFSTTENVAATLLVRQPVAGAQVPAVELSGSGSPSPRTVTPLPSGSDPGQFRVSFGALPEGRYSAKVLGPGAEKKPCVAAFDVRGPLAERLDVRARPDLLRFIANESGGAVLDDVDAKTLAEQFDRHLLATRPARTTRNMAWDRWWILAAVMTCWASAWGLRRWSGLV